MTVGDLVCIGRLGGVDSNGFFHLLLKPKYWEIAADTDEYFLIFNSDRVFFVTISEKHINDRRMYVKFNEDGVAEERGKHKEAIVAVEAQAETEQPPDALLGYSVFFAGRHVGKVDDYFHNSAQYVLSVITPEGRECLIPMVDYYIGKVIDNPGIVELINAESLLDLEESREN